MALAEKEGRANVDLFGDFTGVEDRPSPKRKIDKTVGGK